CLGIFLSPLARRLMHYACLTMPFLGKTVYWEETPPYGLKDVRLQRQITRAIELAKQGDSCQYGLFRTYFGSLLEMNLLTEEFLRNVSAITCPTFLIHSYEDTIASASNSTDVYTMLACQDKRMAMLSGCDHVMTLDLRRNHLSRVIGQFADSIGCSVPKDLLAPAESGLHAYVQNVGGTLESRSRHSLTLKHNQKELVSTQFSVVSPKPLIQRSLAKLLAATLALPLDDRKLVVDVDEELLLKRQGEHEMTWPMVSDLLSRMAKSNRSKGVRFAGKLESTSQRLTAFDC
ncbi:MAG: alpha/beta hydrolase, partial [Cyanobacteria bacterium]|nr:alpha/beta hydrolase [Cyanobacteriota bacterium]